MAVAHGVRQDIAHRDRDQLVQRGRLLRQRQLEQLLRSVSGSGCQTGREGTAARWSATPSTSACAALRNAGSSSSRAAPVSASLTPQA